VKIQTVVAVALGCVGLGFWSVPGGAQSPPPCTSCAGSDWGAPNGTSFTLYMASHRMQRHSVMTSDGAIHIIVDTGTQSSYNGGSQTGTLQLYSSANNGGSWVNTNTLVGTQTLNTTNNTVSTDDVALRTDGAGNQYLDIAYDTEAGGNALMFTELRYRPGLSLAKRWTTSTLASYPLTINSSSSTIYQEPAFAQDQDGNLWLADLEMNSSISQGGIAVYQRKNGTWGSVSVDITGNTTPPNPGPSPSLISLQGTNAFAHAPRPVFVQPNINNFLFGTIGLIFQGAAPNSTTLDCLYWTTITGDPASGASTTPPWS